MAKKATPTSQNITRTHKLEYPFTIAAGEEITSITLRRAKVRDFRMANEKAKDPAEADVILVSLLADMVPEDIDEIDIADWNVIQDFLQKK